MSPTRQQIADALAVAAREQAYSGKLNSADVLLIDNLAASLFARYPVAPPSAPVSSPINLAGPLTARAALELAHSEAIVLEWYKDSAGVGTWGIGVTDKSGHDVDQYRDKPATIEHVLAVFVWLLRKVYVPDVLKAFGSTHLTEAQFAAALSFHYNTGAILHTDWVKLWLDGQIASARTFLENHYLNGGDLTSRREAESALFFDNVWASDGTATVWPVKKPSYRPDWDHPKRVDIRADMDKALVA